MGMEPPPPPAGGSSGGPDWGEMKGKLTATQGPDRMLMIAAVLFVIATFLPWYKVSVVGFVGGSENAWGLGGLGVLAAILGLGAAVLAVALALGSVKIPSAPLLAVGLAGGTLLFTLLRFLFKPGGDAAILSSGVVKISRGFGLWAALVLALAMGVAGYQKFKASN